MAGVLIDLDHLLEYFKDRGPTVNLREIYSFCVKMDMKKMYLVMHSYEIMIALWISIYAFSLSDPWKALAIGLTQHLVFDLMTNPIKGVGYFLTYRAINGFRKDAVLRKFQD